jgi:hypothetical protein
MVRVRCPICERELEVERLADCPSFPFCSPKCRWVDLGRWLGGAYSVPAEDAELEEATGELSP